MSDLNNANNANNINKSDTLVNQTYSPAMTAGDIVTIASRQNAEDERRRLALLNESNKLDEEKRILQRHINNNANPNPVHTTLIVIGIIFALWIMYLIFLKPSVNGIWFDPYGNKVEMCYNKFSGKIKVNVNDQYGGSGLVVDNYIRYGDLVGVWDYNDKIVFVDGVVLHRLL